jgi:hypothetical protein
MGLGNAKVTGMSTSLSGTSQHSQGTPIVASCVVAANPPVVTINNGWWKKSVGMYFSNVMRAESTTAESRS